MMKEKEILQKFFEITGNEYDSLVFLKTFKSLAPESFALIYAPIDIIHESFDRLHHDLKLLHQMELFPVLLIGASSLSYINLFYKNIYNQMFQHALDKRFSAEIIEYVSGYDRAIQYAALKNRIPVLIFEDEADVNEVIPEIAKTLKTAKLIYLSDTGGIREEASKRKISIINLRSEISLLDEIHTLSEDNLKFLHYCKAVLEEKISHKMTIAITSANSLLKELFTVKGSGTFIKLGSEIEVIRDRSKLDFTKLKDLIESAFRRKIDPGFLDTEFDSVLLENSYRAAAIMKLTPFGALLSKYAVDEIARGEGIGRDIWDRMRREYHTIFWRARTDNPINKWYARECQGFDRGEKWNVYWINLNVKDIPSVCEYIRAIPPDFQG